MSRTSARKAAAVLAAAENEARVSAVSRGLARAARPKSFVVS